jgi:tetratricopeptide (TPR) repeat protein
MTYLADAMSPWLRRATLAILLLVLKPGEAAAVQADTSGGRVALALVDSALVVLERGELRGARVLAEDAVELAPKDPRALISLGRVHLAWPRIGRFTALKLFRRAARMIPEDPEPHYWIGRTGLALLGDDGEAIARRGLERTLALDPHFEDAWERWRLLYRSSEDRAGMVELLLPHAEEIEVRGRIAGLWVENGACQRADSLLADLEREALDVRWPAWRAECAYARGRDEEAWAHYQEALALASHDTANVLWAQIASIARPDERAAFAALEAGTRERFYQAFWSPRDPNVRTPANERIGEHFRRRAEARNRFPLLHPLSLYHHSREYRNLVSRVSSAELEDYVAAQLERGTRIAEALSSIELRDVVRPPLEALIDQKAGFSTPDLEGVSPEILPLGRNLPEMIDDRGLVFVRHGPPARYDFRTIDAEEWAYDSEPALRLRFHRGAPMGAAGRAGGPELPEIMFRPLTTSQARSVAVAMTWDRSSLPAPLAFGFWFARFRARDDTDRTELLIFTEPSLAATAVLWDGAGQELGRDEAEAGRWLELESAPIQALLALDVERNDSLGRYRGIVELSAFPPDSLAVSDVLLARAAVTVDAVREEVAALALPSLELPADSAFAIYMEVYGLALEDGLQRYEVTYQLERERSWLGRLLGGRDRVELRFERARRGDQPYYMTELTRIDPGALDPGEYVLRIQVRDLASGRVSASRAVSLHIGR